MSNDNHSQETIDRVSNAYKLTDMSTIDDIRRFVAAFVGVEAPRRTEPFENVLPGCDYTSAPYANRFNWTTYHVRLPELINQEHGWELSGRFTGTMKHPVTGETVDSASPYDEVYAFNKDKCILLHINIDYDGEPHIEVKSEETQNSIDYIVELIEEPNMFIGHSILVSDDGIRVLDVADEGIQPYSDDVEDAVTWLTTIADRKVRDRLDAAKLPSRAGLLLEGPPGSGKTTLARDISRTVHRISDDVTVIFTAQGIAPADIIKLAKDFPCALVIFEDMENIAGMRGSMSFSNLLNEMDGADNSGALMILATTNDSSGFDQAIRRPGRLERKVTIEGVHPGANRDIVASRFSGESDETVDRIVDAINDKHDEGSVVTPAAVDALCRHAIMLDKKGTDIVDYAANVWEPSYQGASYIDNRF